MNPLLYQLWGPDGTLAYEGASADLPADLPALQMERGIIERLLGGPDPSRGIRAVEIKRWAERLGFVSARGCVPGFFNVLPHGIFLNHCVEKFNREHAAKLGAVCMEFPNVFDLASAEMEELTRSYERDGRMFRLGTPDEGKRLAYAADPGLFNWLQGCVLEAERLPYAISSPLPAMRRWKSGELGDLDHLRQYPMSDLHILTTADAALESYLGNTALGSRGARFWAGEDWVVFADVTAEFVEGRPDIGAALARVAEKWTLVRVHRLAPRYYAMRSGILVDAAYADVMLYNMQWDEENPKRFQIRCDDGRPVVVLHGNMATGWPLLLPIVLGRAISKLAPRGFPVELAPVQVRVFPVAEQHVAAAHAWVSEHPHLRAEVIGPERPLGRRIRDAREALCPAFVVMGDREVSSRVQLTYTMTKELIGDDFPDEVKQRIERCRPEVDSLRRSPFVND